MVLSDHGIGVAQTARRNPDVRFDIADEMQEPHVSCAAPAPARKMPTQRIWRERVQSKLRRVGRSGYSVLVWV